MTQSPISHATAVSIGLVITMLGASMSFGIMWQKVNDMDRRLARIEDKLDTQLHATADAGVPGAVASR